MSFTKYVKNLCLAFLLLVKNQITRVMTKSALTYNFLHIITRDKIEFIQQQDIRYIEAMDNYCLIHLMDNSKRIVCKCLKNIFNSLNHDLFLRTHRKYAVNTQLIDNINLKESAIYLKGGIKVAISRSKKKSVIQRFAAIY